MKLHLLFRRLTVAGLSLSVLPCLAQAQAPAGAPPANPGAPAPAAAPTAATPAPTPIAFDDALLKAANNLFSMATAASQDKRVLVIDPLIDGATGAQSAATQVMGRRIASLVQSKYPTFELRPFTASAVDQKPIVLIGTLTAINNAGKADGPRDVYRICLRLVDMRSGKVIAKGLMFAKPEGVDPTPTALFAESPVWTKDPVTDAYIKSCQKIQPGNPADPLYVDRVRTAALISDAQTAYESRHYNDAATLYRSASASSGGDQLRVYSGLYLTNSKLHHTAEAKEAFSKLVDYAVKNNQLAVKFLFRPGSTRFGDYGKTASAYPMWIEKVAEHASENRSCLEVVGHTSPTGPAAFNDRLSVLRAEYVKYQIEGKDPNMGKTTLASGVGSRENIVGTGRDDASDALDRRVEFKIISGCSKPSDSASTTK